MKLDDRIEELYRREPRLKTLYGAIPEFVAGSFWGNWSNIKRAFTRLVGWEAENPELTSSSDYDVIYRHFLAEFERQNPEV